MKVGDKVIIKNLPYLAPYWRGRAATITRIAEDYIELDITDNFTPFSKEEVEQQG